MAAGEQRKSELGFEKSDLPAHRRLRDAEFARRHGDAAVAHDGLQRNEGRQGRHALAEMQFSASDRRGGFTLHPVMRTATIYAVERPGDRAKIGALPP